MINKAREWGFYVGENPVSKVRLPSTANANRVRFLSPEEANFLLMKIQEKSRQFYEICLISLHTGLRAGEVFSLRWQDIDVNNGLIRVADSKSGAAREAYMTEHLKEIFKGKTKGEPRELLFLSQRGERIKSVSGTFDNVMDDLGLNRGVEDRRQKLVFHSLRHTFASWLALDGRPLHEIKELMGHRNIHMTERYAHLIPDQKKKAIKGLEATFEKGRTQKQETAQQEEVNQVV
jgi:integrase